MSKTTHLFDRWSHIWPHLTTLPYPQPGDFVLDYFKEKKDGFYIDVGAHDGIQMSNTVLLEIDKKWSGICFEPNPKVFADLLQNRTCDKFSCAVSNENGVQEFLFCSGYTEMLSGLEGNYEPHHRDRLYNEIKRFGGSVEKIFVQTRTLESVLEEKKITHVDYLSIDTEGSEMAVLSGINFQNTNIQLISLEDNRGGEVEKFLLDRGYKKLTKVCGDCFYEIKI